MIDKIGKNIDKRILDLLKALDDQPFDIRLDALRVVITWYATRMKLERPGEDNSGALLSEFRRAIDGRQETDPAGGRGYGVGGSPGVTIITSGEGYTQPPARDPSNNIGSENP